MPPHQAPLTPAEQVILVQFFVEPNPADAKLRRGADVIVAVIAQRLADAHYFHVCFRLGQRQGQRRGQRRGQRLGQRLGLGIWST